ncbi:uncharacterized protein LOC115882826 [Sitophilus oryzae]|uniref:Uncharacterized protein LOC115882826 n=1 Tax=Sitophilus oryzae TaxID=7048 RepID=A0A6J2XZP3_SITOR|nr:uncharacterized protein LOC115882826 [Sitophilus oryzae]
MEVGVDNYLHKKFKKQLSIDHHRPQNDKENKDSSRNVESREEKNPTITPLIYDHSTAPTTIVTVPNPSTNPPSSTTKSSISVEINTGVPAPLKRSISYAEYDPITNQRVVASPQQTITSSSAADDLSYYRRDSCTPPNNEEYDGMKSDDPQSTPDKNSTGKYVCTYCNLVCSKPSVLQKHIRAHTNERPYPCNSCGFSFKTRSNLYKHCRSRTHANRLNKAQEEITGEVFKQNINHSVHQGMEISENASGDLKNKPYKPRFHTVKRFLDKEASEDDRGFSSTDLSHHINEIISKNNSIINSNDHGLLKKRYSDSVDSVNNNEYVQQRVNRLEGTYVADPKPEEPLNLTNKNRKRSMSEVAEPVIQKSLIKELLLKSLSSDMQCLYCKMIFQTVTELELHKLRSCKGKPSDAKYTRSSSVNVASILTKNKNAFDSMPQFQNRLFPLNSPGPFLGKTRLVESDKSKSFSFDGVNIPLPISPGDRTPRSPNYSLSPLPFKDDRNKAVKMFGGQVKVHSGGGETKSFRIENKEDKQEVDSGFVEYGGKLSENRVVKSSLQSGGTVLTNQANKEERRVYYDVIRVYENTSVSPNIDMANLGKPHFNYEKREEKVSISEPPLRPPLGDVVLSKNEVPSPSHKYTNIADFSQNAIKLLTPNIKQPSISLSSLVIPYNDPKPSLVLHSPRLRNEEVITPSENEIEGKFSKKRTVLEKQMDISSPVSNLYNPMNLFVNGKVVRYVPGIPGPIAAEGPIEMMYGSNIVAVGKPQKEILSPMQPPVILDRIISPKPTQTTQKSFLSVEKLTEKPTLSRMEPPENKTSLSERRSPLKLPEQRSPSKELKTSSSETLGEPKKFIRPNSLALKPTTAALKLNHGLTPTIFNQILISPDTPRVAKKYAQQFLNGNYFTYLGLKSSTKPVYCTLNKTQPFYVPHFKKLSMYSEWRQQDTKNDRLYVSAYDSRQKNQRYTTAGKTVADLIIHSSYKFVVSELPSKNDKSDDGSKSLVGGYESTEDSPYVRGRGRGRYVCDQCGIRCKKPSMLKKHIRTHSNDRPYTCSHCNFSFKTKGNLTKHMKSKSHSKNCNDGESSGPSAHMSASQSSGSDTDDSGMDSSDESLTRQQEHEAAYGLLSLSQKTTSNATGVSEILSPSGMAQTGSSSSNNDQIMTTEEIAYVSKTNYAKNKFLDNLNYKPSKEIGDNISSEERNDSRDEEQSLATYLGKTTMSRPLTYPYTSLLVSGSKEVQTPVFEEVKRVIAEEKSEPKNIKQFHVIQKYAAPPSPEPAYPEPPIERTVISKVPNNVPKYLASPVPTLKVNDVVIQDNPSERKRKITFADSNYQGKVHRNDEVMDLSMANSEKRDVHPVPEPGTFITYEELKMNQEIYSQPRNYSPRSPQTTEKEPLLILKHQTPHEPPPQTHYSYPESDPQNTNSSDAPKIVEYDNSAMETLADVATKQVKLEKNMLAKSVATEYLKLMTQNEGPEGGTRDVGALIGLHKDVNDLLVKPEGNKSCSICSKSFNKPSQLRLHMNIHYLERPFRCDSCSVSFRTKGHLQKHERSASHYSKLSSSPAQSSSEPRPFKCSDCNIAFRIHGHLAKHLRSKMHIMRLECLDKIPFGLYAELERSNSLLTEINTSDVDQCLESLKTLAKKVFINDPNKLQTIFTNHQAEHPGSNINQNS